MTTTTTFSHLHLAATVSSNSADSSAAHKAASLFPVLYLYICICVNNLTQNISAALLWICALLGETFPDFEIPWCSENDRLQEQLKPTLYRLHRPLLKVHA